MDMGLALAGFYLFPFNRARRLGGDVIDHAVDSLNFVGDARGNFGQQLMGQVRPLNGQKIRRIERADDNWKSVCPGIALHPD